VYERAIKILENYFQVDDDDIVAGLSDKTVSA